VIEHTGTTSRIVFGELDGRPSDRSERILEALVAGGVDAEITPDIRAQLWTKFSFICAVAGMTAAVRLPIGPIRDDPVSWAMFRSILEEVTALARAEGVDLTPDLVDRQLALTSGLAADSYSSLHHDLVNGRRMELEALHGTVVTRARGHRPRGPGL
jgi:2-dehydropantoate 2-reductase